MMFSILRRDRLWKVEVRWIEKERDCFVGIFHQTISTVESSCRTVTRRLSRYELNRAEWNIVSFRRCIMVS